MYHADKTYIASIVSLPKSKDTNTLDLWVSGIVIRMEGEQSEECLTSLVVPKPEYVVFEGVVGRLSVCGWLAKSCAGCNTNCRRTAFV